MVQYIVALTGGIGSGKSTVANAFFNLGISLVDADVIARKVVEPDGLALHAIAQHFGPAVLNANKSLDRAKLRTLIFSDPEEKVWLNNLLHPFIQWQTEQQLYSVHMPYVLWVVPLLIEKKLQQRANRVLVVDVDHEVQIARTRSRDGVSHKQVENILAAQVSRQHRLSYADDIINNNGHPQMLMDRVATLHQRYLSLAALAT